MENSNPLHNLSLEELIKLWNTALAVDDIVCKTYDHIMGYYGYGDALLSPGDINRIRAGVMLHAKLCDEYGIPHPDIKLDLGVNERLYMKNIAIYDGDEETEDIDDDYEREIIEYLNENLHKTMSMFATMDKIGDVEEKHLYYQRDDLENILKGEEFVKDIDGFTDELKYSGYREALDIISFSPDEMDVIELKVAESEKFALLDAAVRSGEAPREVVDFWNSFVMRTARRTHLWVPSENMVEVREDTGKWCSVFGIFYFYEEGIVMGDLYKYMSIRIGTYIAQEIADRYGMPTAA